MNKTKEEVDERKGYDWFEKDKTHKSFNYGNGLRIPVCKVYRRSEFPKEGVYSPFDKVSRVWRKVDCSRCNTIGGLNE